MSEEPIDFVPYFERLTPWKERRTQNGWDLWPLSGDSEANRVMSAGLAKIALDAQSDLLVEVKGLSLFHSAIVVLTKLPSILLGMNDGGITYYHGTFDKITEVCDKLKEEEEATGVAEGTLPLKLTILIDYSITGGLLDDVSNGIKKEIKNEYGREAIVTFGCLLEEAVPGEEQPWQTRVKLGDSFVCLASHPGDEPGFLKSLHPPAIYRSEIGLAVPGFAETAVAAVGAQLTARDASSNRHTGGGSGQLRGARRNYADRELRDSISYPLHPLEEGKHIGGHTKYRFPPPTPEWR